MKKSNAGSEDKPCGQLTHDKVREDTLIARSQMGDCDAFQQLINLHEKSSHALALRICSNHADAEDLLAIAFGKVWKGIGTYRANHSFRSWLGKIITLAHIDNLRKVKIIVLSYDACNDEEIPIIDLFPAPNGNPEDVLDAKILSESLAKALEQLPESLRLLFTLRYIEGLTYSAIAEIVACPEGTVKSRLCSARKKLQALLSVGEVEPKSCSKPRSVASPNTDCSNRLVPKVQVPGVKAAPNAPPPG